MTIAKKTKAKETSTITIHIGIYKKNHDRRKKDRKFQKNLEVVSVKM